MPFYLDIENRKKKTTVWFERNGRKQNRLWYGVPFGDLAGFRPDLALKNSARFVSYSEVIQFDGLSAIHFLSPGTPKRWVGCFSSKWITSELLVIRPVFPERAEETVPAFR